MTSRGGAGPRGPRLFHRHSALSVAVRARAGRKIPARESHRNVTRQAAAQTESSMARVFICRRRSRTLRRANTTSAPTGSRCSIRSAILIEGTLDFDLAGPFADLTARPALLRRVFATIEDLRIDAAMRRRYPGARGDLDRVLAHALALRPHNSAPCGRCRHSLKRCCSTRSGRRATLCRPASRGDLLARLIATAAVVQRQGARVDDSCTCGAAHLCGTREPIAPAAAAPSAPAARQDLVRPRESVESWDDDEFSAGDAAGLAVRFSRRTDDGPLRQATHRRTDSQPQDRTLTRQQRHVAASSSDCGKCRRSPRSRPRRFVRAPVSAGPRSFLYDEWDFHRQSYIAAWCRVYEHRLRGDDFGFIGGVRSRHAALEKEVRRRFGSIKPLSWQRVRRTSDGDELDLDGVIESRDRSKNRARCRLAFIYSGAIAHGGMFQQPFSST